MKLLLAILFVGSLAQAQSTCLNFIKSGVVGGDCMSNYDKSVVVNNPQVLVDGVYIQLSTLGDTSQGFCRLFKKKFVAGHSVNMDPALTAVLLQADGSIYNTITGYYNGGMWSQIRCK